MRKVQIMEAGLLHHASCRTDVSFRLKRMRGSTLPTTRRTTPSITAPSTSIPVGDDALWVSPERWIRFLTRSHLDLRVPQPPGGGQDGREHPDPAGRQPGAAVELQRLR